MESGPIGKTPRKPPQIQAPKPARKCKCPKKESMPEKGVNVHISYPGCPKKESTFIFHIRGSADLDIGSRPMEGECPKKGVNVHISYPGLR
ncbi:MAG: hypothetical protein DRI24_22455 [Deltaproteobacteria bacterium]|nr:MAG: hypothetical protein DRI24_22455 [Deltaproteobacteria bacterium]